MTGPGLKKISANLDGARLGRGVQLDARSATVYGPLGPRVVGRDFLELLRLMRSPLSRRQLRARLETALGEPLNAASCEAFLAFCARNEWLERGFLGDLRLREALDHAAKTVPFYRAWFRRCRGKPLDLRCWPQVTAQDFKRAWGDFYSDAFERPELRDPRTLRNYAVGRTSGTTGRGNTVVIERDVQQARLLCAAAIRRQPEGDPGTQALLNRPSALGFDRLLEKLEMPLCRKRGYLLISPGGNPTRVRPEVWDRCLEALARARPEMIIGDPAYVAGLAHRALTTGFQLPSLVSIRLGHGYAWKAFRAAIARAFGVPIETQYHCAEFGDLAASCPQGRLHLLEPLHRFELSRRGSRVRRGAAGALVVTAMDARLRPMIRYAIGDIVRLGARCVCGHDSRTITYLGRACDVFMGPRGRLLTTRDVDGIVGQVPEAGFFRIRVKRAAVAVELVAAAQPQPQAAVALAGRLANFLGRKVETRWVKSLPVTVHGKFRALIVEEGNVPLREWLGEAP